MIRSMLSIISASILLSSVVVSATTAPTASPTAFLSKYNYVFQTAGVSTSASVVTVGGRATSCTLVGPKGIWQDSTGQFYVSDTDANCVVSFDQDGDTIVKNFAGKCSTAGNTGIGGQATAATIDGVLGINGDTSGNIYFVDFNNIMVKKVSTSGMISKFAGDGASSAPIYGRPATSCSLDGVSDLWVDSLGVIYTASQSLSQISKVDTSGIITNFAGVAYSTTFAGDGGPATSANLYKLGRMTGMSTGTIVISDAGNNRVRTVPSSGIISTIVGTGTTTFTTENLPGTSANVGNPIGLAFDSSTGNGYIADLTNTRVYMYTASDTRVNTFAGTGTSGYSGNGGLATSATFNSLRYTYLSTAGNVYIADYGNRGVRGVYTLVPTVSPTLVPTTIKPTVQPSVIPTTVQPSLVPTAVPSMLPTFVPTSARSTQNNIYTVAGTGTSATSTGTGGKATAAVFNNPRCVIQDTAGFIYSSEQNGHCVRRFSASAGIVLNFVGTCSTSGTSGDGSSSTSALITNPLGIFIDTVGVFKVVENGSNRVRSVTAGGIISKFAGTGSSGISGDGGQATSATFIGTEGVWGNSVGVIYITMVGNSGVRAISTSGIITRFAGINTYVNGVTADGSQATSSSLTNPEHVSGDSTGGIYIVESGNNKIRVVSTSSGILTTFAGNGNTAYNGENLAATSTTMSNPLGDTRDLSNGDYYYSDSSNGRIRVVTRTTGLVTTFAGNGDTSQSTGSGGAATSATFLIVDGLYLNTAGQMYVQEIYSGRVNVIYSVAPSAAPSVGPTISPTVVPTSAKPSVVPTVGPTVVPSVAPTVQPTTTQPSVTPSVAPSLMPTIVPTVLPSQAPSVVPTVTPSVGPSVDPTVSPSVMPSIGPTVVPSAAPSVDPTMIPTVQPSIVPTVVPSQAPSVVPTVIPSVAPSIAPSAQPSVGPTVLPSVAPSVSPSVQPSIGPSVAPTVKPSVAPSVAPSVVPTGLPSIAPSASPTVVPSVRPTVAPSIASTSSPTLKSLPISTSPSYKVTNMWAFAALKSEGTVVTWGAADSGGDSSSVSGLLVNVVQVVSSKNAFAALKSDGSVVAWGASAQVSGSTAFRSNSNIVSLVANEQAFAGLTSSGGVIAFGAACCGGNADQYGWASDLTSNVVSIAASAGAFAAVKADGSVYTWGSSFAGGGVSSATRSDLNNVVMVSASKSAFAALTSEGSVVTWGCSQSGGVMSSVVASSLSQKTQYIVSSVGAFAGYTSAGGVVAWGRQDGGGDSSSVTDELSSDVKFVAHTATAFAAVKTSGSVVAWGSADAGGDLSSVSFYLTNVSRVVGNGGAFAALTVDNRVVTWGLNVTGGELAVGASAGVSVSAVYHTSRAFAALHKDGSVSSWGASSYGGSIPSSVTSYLNSGIKIVCANDVAFTAIRRDGVAVAWGHSRARLGSYLLSGNLSAVVSC